MRVAYLVNQYPKVSHSFIRREINALEASGVYVVRHAMRGWDADLKNEDDIAEQRRTRYLLRRGGWGLLGAVARTLVGRPVRAARTLALALKLSLSGDRPAPLWLAYFAEACQLSLWLQEGGIRHVHAHFGTNSTTVAMLAAELGACTYSFTVHGPEEFDKPQFIHLGEKVRRARFVAAISSYGRSQLYRWVDQAHWHKVHVVRCGLDRAFHDVPDTPMPDVPQFVCVGRLCEQKGQLLLIEAAALLRAQERRFQLILAGDGEMRPAIEALVRTRDLADCVRITGWVSSAQVRELMQASRVMVLPSFAEGLPVVLMEALALRRPVVTTAIAGVPELVAHGVHGWLVVPGSVHALADAMAAALDASPTQLQAMGRHGREAVLLRHDIDREAARLAELLQAVTHVSLPAQRSLTPTMHRPA